MSQILVTGEAKIRDIQGPVVANSGVITALDGAANQYVRGDGTLAIFPSSSGGGSSVSYYLNGSVNQGTFGGSTYYQMSRNAIVGTGTNFSTSSDGLIAQFITDANDPDVVSIPSGNWNVEFFMNVSASSGALASFYVEIYKYNGSTFTLLATNVATPEQLTNTTTVDAYFTSVAMPLSAMAVTDRLAVRIFANVASKTVTLYTEDNRLCQIVTTFSNGLTSLNNLTDQSQYLATGTSGTDFNIVSSGDTHTFNIPSASASNRGLITTGSQTIAGIKTLSVPSQFEQGLYLKQNMNLFQAGYIGLGASTTGLIVGLSGGGFGTLNFNNTTSFTYTFPNATGTIALTSDLSSYVPYTGATGDVNLGLFSIISNRVSAIGDNSTYGGTLSIKQNNVRSLLGTGYTELFGKTNLLGISFGVGSIANLSNSVLTAERTYTLPDITGTLALLEGTQTFTGDKLFNGSVDFNNSVNINSGLFIRNNVIGSTLYTSFTITKASSTQTLSYLFSTGFASNLLFNDAANYSYTFPAASGTLALTSDIPSLTGYVPYTGATTNVNIGNNNYLGGSILLNQSAGSASATGYLSLSGSTGAGTGAIVIGLGSGTSASMSFPTSSNYSYIFPATSGTLALTSDLSAYLPLTGGTLTGALSGTSATFSGNGLFGGSTNAGNAGGFTLSVGVPGTTAGGIQLWAATNQSSFLQFGDSTTPADNYRGYIGYNHATDTLSLGTASADKLTIASTGAATFSDSVTNKVTNISADGAGVVLQGYVDNSLRIAVRGSGYNSGARGGLLASTGDFSSSVTMGGDLALTPTDSAIAFTSGAGRFFAGGAERMRITSSGYVLINTTSSNGWPLEIQSLAGGEQIYLKRSAANAQMFMGGVNAADTLFYIRSNGSGGVVLSSGATSWASASDERLKNINNNIEDAVGKLQTLRAVNFAWKKDKTNKNNLGLIAQDVEKVFPEVISFDKERDEYSVRYTELIPVLVKAIQESHQIIKDLEARIVTLESKIN